MDILHAIILGLVQGLTEFLPISSSAHLILLPKLMDLVGRVDGTLYMLPFYNYSMAVIYRKDLIEDPAEQAAFKEKYLDTASEAEYQEAVKNR